MKECKELFSKKLQKLEHWNHVVMLCIEKTGHMEELQEELKAMRTQLQKQTQDRITAREELHAVERSLQNANSEHIRLEQQLATLRCEQKHDAENVRVLSGEVSALEHALRKTGSLLQQKQNANCLRRPLVESQLHSIQRVRKLGTLELLTGELPLATSQNTVHTEIMQLENCREALLQRLQRRRHKIAAAREKLASQRQKQECLTRELKETEVQTQNMYLVLYNQNKMEQQQNDTIQELQNTIWDTESRLEQMETKDASGHLSFILQSLSERLTRVRASRLALQHQLRTAKAVEEKRRMARKGMSVEDCLKHLMAEIVHLERQSEHLKILKQELEERDKHMKLQVMQQQHLIHQQSCNAVLQRSFVVQFEKEMRERRREAEARIHAARREHVQADRERSAAAKMYRERARRVASLQARYESLMHSRGFSSSKKLQDDACSEGISPAVPPVIAQEMEQLRIRVTKLQETIDVATAKLNKTTQDVTTAQNALRDLHSTFTPSSDPDQDSRLQQLDSEKLGLQEKIDSINKNIASTLQMITQLKQMYLENSNQELEQKVKALSDVSESLSHDLSQISMKQVRALAHKRSMLRSIGSVQEQHLALHLEVLQELKRRANDRVAELAQETTVRVTLRDICMQEKIVLPALEERPRTLRERMVKATEVKKEKHIMVTSPIAKINLGVDLPGGLH